MKLLVLEKVNSQGENEKAGSLGERFCKEQRGTGETEARREGGEMGESD